MNSDKYLNDLEDLARRVSRLSPILSERNRIQDQACYILLTDEQKKTEIRVGQVWKREDGLLFRTTRFDDLGIWQMLGVSNKGATSETPNFLRLYWVLQNEIAEREK